MPAQSSSELTRLCCDIVSVWYLSCVVGWRSWSQSMSRTEGGAPPSSLPSSFVVLCRAPSPENHRNKRRRQPRSHRPSTVHNVPTAPNPKKPTAAPLRKRRPWPPARAAKSTWRQQEALNSRTATEFSSPPPMPSQRVVSDLVPSLSHTDHACLFHPYLRAAHLLYSACADPDPDPHPIAHTTGTPSSTPPTRPINSIRSERTSNRPQSSHPADFCPCPAPMPSPPAASSCSSLSAAPRRALTLTRRRSSAAAATDDPTMAACAGCL